MFDFSVPPAAEYAARGTQIFADVALERTLPSVS